jgi:hypothetical protein
VKCSICAATVGVQHVPELSFVDRSIPCGASVASLANPEHFPLSNALRFRRF